MSVTKDQPPRIRAFDKVYEYLDLHFKVSERTESFPLPPIREIAKKTGISPSSARNVLLGLAEQGHVKIFPGSGAFWVPQYHRKKKELVIGINTSPQRILNNWNAKLYGGMVRSAIQSGIELKFKPFIYEPAFPERVNFSRLKESVQGIDGCFLAFPFNKTLEVTEFLEKLRIPCFFYNPLSLTKTTNFLSPDYFDTAQKIGLVWKQTGRKRILLLQAPGMQRSTSCQLLYSGLVSGLGMEGETLPEVHKINVPENLSSHGSAAFREFVIRTGKIPDAVYCTADELALGVLTVARELKIEVPTAMSVIGGNGRVRSSSDGEFSLLLTATKHPVEQIGENFVHLFQKRAANQMRDVPGLYFPMRMLIGQTTRAEENKLFVAHRE